MSGWNVEYDDFEACFSVEPAGAASGAYSTREEAQPFAEALNKQPKHQPHPRLVVDRGRVYLAAPLLMRIIEEVVARGGELHAAPSYLAGPAEGFQAHVSIPLSADANHRRRFIGSSLCVEDDKPHRPSVREALERALMAYEVGKP